MGMGFLFFKNYLVIFGCTESSLLCKASEGCSPVAVVGVSLQWLLLPWSTGSETWAPVGVAHRLSCLAACGIFPDHGLNPYPLHWQADS